MQEIPLAAVPAQRLSIVLDGQEVTIRLYQRGKHLFMDLDVLTERVFTGFVCQNRQDVKQYAHLPFKGGLYFVDADGEEDPHYTGFGAVDRFRLLFVATGETVPEGLRPRKGFL